MKHTVLFADRDPYVVSAIERLFADDDVIDVLTASTPDDALAHIDRSAVDLVVADTMRIADKGSELLAEVRRKRPELPLILLTDEPPGQYEALCQRLGGGLPVIQKPWDVDKMRQSIAAQLAVDVESAAPSDEKSLLALADLTPQKLERARRIRQRMENPPSLAEVLAQLGELTPQQLETFQRERQARLSLIEILQERGDLDEEQVAAYVSAKTGRPGLSDYDILVGQEIVGEEAFLRAIAIKRNLTYREPDVNAIDRSVLGKTSFRYLLKHSVLPIEVKDSRLRVILASPLDDELLLDLQRIFTVPLDVQVCTRERIVEALRTLERLEAGDGDRETSLEYRIIEEVPQNLGAGDEAVQIVDYLIMRAIQLGASDLHMEPMENRMRVRVRVDGVLHTLTELPPEAILRVVSRVKVLASADIAERRLHQDGKILVKAQGGEIDIRMSSYASAHGETIVLRLLDRNRGLVPMDSLGFQPKIQSVIQDVILPMSTGLVLMTGPTGSGKTTTLYSFVQHHLDPTEKVITAEDPIEYVTDGIVQCAVNEKTGPTFADSLRSMLRQDPDTIVVGEMRDSTTARLAFEAALTGHKVYSTFHTDDSIVVAVRLLEMGVEPFLIASALSAVLAQRLLRRLCTHCRVPARPTGKQLHFMQIDTAAMAGARFQGAKGCVRCDGTGYKGRLGIHEVLMPDDDFKDAVLSRASSKELRHLARRQPQFLSLQEDGLLKAARGETDMAELVSNLPRNVPPRPLAELKKIAGTKREK